MLRDSYDVQFEGTAVRSNEPRLLRENSVPRDQGWSWVVLFAAFLTLFITNGVHTSFGILYAALLSHFKSGREETAWIGSISLGLLCFFSPIASVLIEQIGCRATSAIGGLLCSLGFLLSSFATGIALLYFTHGVLFGLGTSLTYTAAMTVVTRCFDRKRNIATGLCSSGSQFGGISLAPLSQVLFDRLGFANTFRTFSGLLLVVAISSLAYRPEIVEGQPSVPTAKKSPREMLNVWKSKAYTVWALATTMITLGYNIPRYFLVKYAIDLGISKDASAWLISYLCASSAVGRILYGRLCELIPKVQLCQGCVMGCVMAALLFPFLKSYLALVIACFVFGLPDGGFISALPVVTTEIVGPERMAEGFGFVLFCQSYSNILGPPLSGMLYDTYQSYEAAFCFAAVPEFIGILMMFLIPYYTRNQVNYRREIDLSSNSGILLGDGVNTTTPPSSPREDLQHPTQKPVGNYNVVINLLTHVPASDIGQINVIIKSAATETNCIENANPSVEVSSSKMVERTNDTEEQTSENTYAQTMNDQNIASHTAITAKDCSSTANIENTKCLQPSTSGSYEVATAELVQRCPPGVNHVGLKVLNSHDEFIESQNHATVSVHQIIADDCSSIVKDSITATTENEKIPELVVQNVTVSATPNEQLLTETIVDVSVQSTNDKALQTEESLIKDVTSPMPQSIRSDKSITSVNSSMKVGIPSNNAFVPVANEEVETIINLTKEEPLPRLTPPPQVKGHNTRVKSETKNLESTEQLTDLYQETAITPLISSPTSDAFISRLDTFVQDSFASHDIPFTHEGGNPSVSIDFTLDPTVQQNEPSLMTSAGINDSFVLQGSTSTSIGFTQNESSLLPSSGMKDVSLLVQNQLPEPLKPTSVCSVGGNTLQTSTNSSEVHPCSNLEKASASSPLSCELSTVIADVIQSLTSQHATSSKPKRESATSSIATNPSAAASPSMECAQNLEASYVGQADAALEVKNSQCCKELLPPGQTSCGEVSARSKMQTSVLDTMQSIVAEGCPEDFALLEDISIDLTLDKDPSIASIVLLEDSSLNINPNRISHEAVVQNTSSFSVPDQFEQQNYSGGHSGTGGIHSGFLQRTNELPMLNVFPETIVAHQAVESSPGPTELSVNPIESTNPFYNNISQVQ